MSLTNISEVELGSSADIEVNLSLFDKLESGTYRIVKNVSITDHGEMFNIYSEFEITD